MGRTGIETPETSETQRGREEGKAEEKGRSQPVLVLGMVTNPILGKNKFLPWEKQIPILGKTNPSLGKISPTFGKINLIFGENKSLHWGKKKKNPIFRKKKSHL